MDWWTRVTGTWPEKLAPQVRSLFLLELRSIWIERNKRIFNQNSKPEALVLDAIVEEAERCKLVGFM
jgi:hypothetical protein